MEFPDESANREKDYIVAKSSMLRVFFDSGIKSEPEIWLDRVSDEAQDLRVKIEPEVGKSRIENGLAHLTSEYFGGSVFPENSDKEQAANLTEAIAIVGYQIGDEGETMSIYGDLYDVLCVYGLLQYNTESAAFTYKALATGVLWARKTDLRHLQPYTEFVKGLDMTGL